MSRILSFLGGQRLRLATSVDQRDIVHIKQYLWPEFHFEWHQREGRLYCTDLTKVPRIGNLIGTDLKTRGAAHNAMLIWCRGYRAGKEALSHDDQGKLILFGGKENV